MERRAYHHEGSEQVGNPFLGPSDCLPIQVFSEKFEHFSSEQKGSLIRGRVVKIREHKNTIFFDLKDESGQIQIIFAKQEGASYRPIVGDLLIVEGKAILSISGEPSLCMDSCQIVARREKTENRVDRNPKKGHLLGSFENLIYDTRAFELAKNIALLTSNMRTTLNKDGFVEFETPILKNIHEAGTSRPFTTWHNSLRKEMYLRTTVESELKKLLAAQFEKVYEIGKLFRNQGLDRKFLPEFTVLEAYVAYINYTKLMNYFQYLVYQSLVQTYGDGKIETQSGAVLDFSKRWQVVSCLELMPEIDSLLSTENLEEPYEQRIVKAIDKVVVPQITQPTFIIDYPAAMSPLAKRRSDNLEIAERAIAVADGKTFCDLFSDETDPSQLLENFLWEDKFLYGGKHIDHQQNQLIKVAKEGMPPSASFGLSMSRLYMIVNGVNDIRDTALFLNR